MLSGLKPLKLVARRDPFDDPDWVFELKHDGFRALAYVKDGACRLVSRNGHRFQEFALLERSLTEALEDHEAILDGEIVCLGPDGRSRFYELLARRGEPYYYAFDLVWLDGGDLRGEPLVERKARLRALTPDPPSRLLHVDHVERQGVALFAKVVEMDLEGIVAKRKKGLYREGTRWWKIKNPDYSQAEGRSELFDERRARS